MGKPTAAGPFTEWVPCSSLSGVLADSKTPGGPLGRLLGGFERALAGFGSLQEALGGVWEALGCFLEAPRDQSSENTNVVDGFLGSPRLPRAESTGFDPRGLQEAEKHVVCYRKVPSETGNCSLQSLQRLQSAILPICKHSKLPICYSEKLQPFEITKLQPLINLGLWPLLCLVAPF